MDNRSNIYNLPYTTEQILKEIQPEKACENLGLLLDKYIPINVFEKPSRENPQAGKAPWLMSIFKPESGKETQNNHIDAVFARNAYNRWHTMTQTMGAEPFDLTIDWRMVIGLGGETVLETDINLHHLYGIPFIPGSALKGLTRAYITGEIEGYKSDKIEKDNEEVKLIFGSQERAGRVIFFDAMPNGVVKFVLDIINPHYADYYGGTKPPTNDQSPIPVTFLTVADTTFTFALAPRNSNDPEHKADVEKVKGWLREALQKYGVGGKTSAGYGYFKKEMSSSEPPQPKKAQEPVTQAQAPSRPAEYMRPRIPQFREGQDITGSVVTPTDDLRRIAPPDARAFLRYQSFATKDVLIVISAEEAQHWKPGETRICLFVHEEVRDGCTVLICKPRIKKAKDKK